MTPITTYLRYNNRIREGLVATVVKLKVNFLLKTFVIKMLSFQYIKDRLNKNFKLLHHGLFSLFFVLLLLPNTPAS